MESGVPAQPTPAKRLAQDLAFNGHSSLVVLHLPRLTAEAVL